MRRTKAQIDDLKIAIRNVCSDLHPMTVRQLFYQLTSLGFIDKTEGEYKNTVCRLTKQMRLAGELPWEWLSDSSRWMHKPRTYGGISDLLTQSHHAYRRALWDPNTNSHYCEVWIEKDALTGVFVGVTGEYDVPLMPCKGYPSLSFQRDAARRLSWAITDRLPENDFAPYPEAHVYYFGDFDPSGKDIPRNCEVRMREFLSELGGEEFFHFHQVAVNHEQIELMGLPTRPTKKTDSRSAKFGHTISVELDAINPGTLRQLTRDCITPHIDDHQLRALQATEEQERALLRQISTFTKRNGEEALRERLSV